MGYESLKNTGIWHLNGKPSGAQRTIIVVGVARSGTSMVAGALHALGVPMGESSNDVVFEDRDLAGVFEGGGGARALEELLRERDRQNPIWGWKRPAAFHYLRPHLDRFRNPTVIATFRDVLAISMRNAISVKSEVLKGLKAAHRETRALLDFVAALKTPAMLVSYEKALFNPTDFAAALAEFAGLELNRARAEAVASFIQPDRPSYLRQARVFPVLGGISAVRNGYLVGWAKDPRSAGPVTLRLKVNGKPWREVRADVFRPDLSKKQIGNGHHGFRIDLSELGDLPRPIEISVIDTTSGEDIRNSPFTLTAEVS